MKIRLARIEDAKALSELNEAFNGVEKQDVEAIANHLISSDELVAVAILNDEVVGFACAQSFTSFCYEELQGEITEMYVKESARREGAARSMIALLEKHLFERGVREIKLLTGQTNYDAINTYENSGYVKEDEQVLTKMY